MQDTYDNTGSLKQRWQYCVIDPLTNDYKRVFSTYAEAVAYALQSGGDANDVMLKVIVYRSIVAEPESICFDWKINESTC
jgi:hypothetical protein